jgi:ferredoxin
LKQQSLVMKYSKDVVDQAVISKAIKMHEIEINILKARISPDEEGYMFALIKGDDSEVFNAISFIKKSGVSVHTPEQNLIKNDTKCTHCGACVSHCLSSAISINENTYEVMFAEDKCIGCELCIPTCPYDALSSVSEIIK